MCCPESDYAGVLEESKQIIRQCFKEYKLEEVFLSFNGGKDCTVLLDVTLTVLKEIYKSSVADRLKVLCIRTNNPFKELEEFMEIVERHYGLKLIFTQGEIRETLERIVGEDERLKACLMGTRRTDPYSEHLQFMQKTDPSWPQLMRVSPLLNWSYHHIWTYTHDRKVPYCSLYDKGYTSIGSTLNTWPNPALAYTNSNGTISYHPAWQLKDGSLERAGRGTKPKPTSNGSAPSNGLDCQRNGDTV